MPISNQRLKIRKHRPRGGLNPHASYLLLAVLAANHSAARAAPGSLPYLTLHAPSSLRVAPSPPTLPPPPPLVLPAVTAEAAPVALVASPPVAEGDVPAALPAADAAAAAAGAGAVGPPSAAPGGKGAESAPMLADEILPDLYARPRVVTVQDLLPFFLPPPTAVSRATYEVK